MADQLSAPAASPSLEDIEIQLLLEGIALHYGYDFRDYALSPLRRNIVMSMAMEGVPTISRYQERVLHDPESMERFLNAVGVNVTSLFREADSLLYLRREIVPWLRTFPSARIWVAGCATGEEVVSLAIVLHETGMLHRTRIYATDINERSLTIARMRGYSLENVRSCEADYLRSGGIGRLSDYYVRSEDVACFDRSLTANVTWARHNLATDASFNEFQVVLCTNVLGHFSRPLQQRVHSLLHGSLAPSGYLMLGCNDKDAGLRGEDHFYERISDQPGVYRMVRP
jgi:chemotaxis protein methyltransferase CheR